VSGDGTQRRTSPFFLPFLSNEVGGAGAYSGHPNLGGEMADLAGTDFWTLLIVSTPPFNAQSGLWSDRLTISGPWCSISEVKVTRTRDGQMFIEVDRAA